MEKVIFTTIEKLQLEVSASYGAVIQYGDKVFVTDITWKGGFTAEIFEFIEFPEDTRPGRNRMPTFSLGHRRGNLQRQRPRIEVVL